MINKMLVMITISAFLIIVTGYLVAFSSLYIVDSISIQESREITTHHIIFMLERVVDILSKIHPKYIV